MGAAVAHPDKDLDDDAAPTLSGDGPAEKKRRVEGGAEECQLYRVQELSLSPSCRTRISPSLPLWLCPRWKKDVCFGIPLPVCKSPTIFSFFVVFLTLFICRISLHFTSRLLTNNLTTQLHSLHTHPSSSTPPLPAASLSLRLLCAVSVTSIYLCGRLVATQLWETPRVARRVQKVLLCRGGVSLREMMGQAQLRRRAR